MFKSAVQYVDGMAKDAILQSEFSNIEFRWENVAKAQEAVDNGMKVSGLLIKAVDLSTESLSTCVATAKELGAEYVVIETLGIESREDLYELIRVYIVNKGAPDIKILIENSYKQAGEFRYYNDFADGWKLRGLVAELNKLCEGTFGICVNVGYANMVSANIKEFIKDCGKDISLVHINDNDGLHNQQQMPYTFTTGRGALSTDWGRIIGALYKLNYSGWLVFDTAGTFKRAPKELQKTMLSLLSAMKSEWEDSFNIEQKLNQPGKKLILFGAGKMAHDYLAAFGDKYQPAFLVDNNKDIWGQVRLGYEVKSPQAILEIPASERNVWICNMYYDAISSQLESMGVEYNCYIDQYYL